MVALVLCTPLWAHPALERQIADLNLRIEEQPRDAQLLLQRGELHRIHQDWKAAKADFLQARRVDPELDTVEYLLGKLKLEAGAPREARKHLDRFLREHPDHVKARVTRARALVRLDKLVPAAEEFTRAIDRIGPDGNPLPTYYLERARALAAAGKDHQEAAVRGLDEGLRRLGEPVTLQLYAIELELDRGRYDAALVRVERIAEKANRQETWLVRRGEILEQAGRDSEARVAYSAALDAIGALPVSRRSNRAVRALQSEAEAALERLHGAP